MWQFNVFPLWIIQCFWVYLRAVCREVAKAYVHLRAGENHMPLWSISPCAHDSAFPMWRIIFTVTLTVSRGIKDSLEGQRWQHPGRHHHVVKFRVVDTRLRSQVLSSAKVSLAHNRAFWCVSWLTKPHDYISAPSPVSVCGMGDPSHLKPVNATQWPKSKLNQTVAKLIPLCPVMKHMLGNWHLGYRKNDSLRKEHRAWENLG